MLQPIEVHVTHASRRVAFAPLIRLLRAVIDGESAAVESLTVVLVDHRSIRDLNKVHLGRAYTTDVIAFDLREPQGSGHIDGEIYVDLDTAAERAPDFGVRYTDEVRRYAVHGLLHLIGYRDDTAEGKATMRRLEDRYLDAFAGG